MSKFPISKVLPHDETDMRFNDGLKDIIGKVNDMYGVTNYEITFQVGFFHSDMYSSYKLEFYDGKILTCSVLWNYILGKYTIE
jgi:hypothetical protein